MASSAIRQLRSARRQRARREGRDWIEASYEFELRGIVAIALVIAVPAFLAGDAIGLADIGRFRADAPGVASLALAGAAWIALTAGARGAPLAPSSADVQHLLLAPVSRAHVLRPLAWAQLRSVLLVGTILGATVGGAIGTRVPQGETAAWFFAGALAGLCISLFLWGLVAIASALRCSRLTANLIGAALVGWAALDAAAGTWSAPTTWLGAIALLPLPNLVPVAALAAGIVLAVVIPTVAIVRIGDNALPPLARRSGLVSELHSAAAFTDARTVVLLHRQLAAEAPRRRPWLRLPVRARVRDPIWRRGWHGYLRWPLTRAIRVVLLAGAAAALAVAAQSTPLVVTLAGLAAFVAALDVIEPFAQEVDRPLLHRTYAVRAEQLLGRNLVAPVSALLVVAVMVFVVASALGATVVLAAAVAGCTTLAAVAGAAANVALGPPTVNEQFNAMITPEIYGPILVLRQCLPPALVVAGFVPVLVAASAEPDALGPALFVAAGVAVVSIATMVFAARRGAQ